MKTNNNTKKNTNAMTETLKNILDGVNNEETITSNKRIVKQCKDEMKLTGMSWAFAYIPISEIITEMGYQRPTDEARVRSIIKKFEMDKVDVKCVNYRPEEDKFAIMDGLHTLTALKDLGYKFIPCKVFIGKSYEEEAAFFASQNKGVKKISTVEEFKALLEAGNEMAKDIVETLDIFDCKIAPIAGVRKCRTVRKLTKIYKDIGDEGLYSTLNLLYEVGWLDTDPKAMTEGALNVGYYSYPLLQKQRGYGINKTKWDILVKHLSQYTTSTQFVDQANMLFAETVTKHPEACVKQMVEKVMDKVNEKYTEYYDVPTAKEYIEKA